MTVVFAAAEGFSQTDAVIVQPGAPGQPTKTLPADTRAKLPPTSTKDVEFMQGMIHHHAQAVEMAALIESRSTNREVRLLGARVSHSQGDEIRFMERWLKVRGQPTKMPAAGRQAYGDHAHHGQSNDSPATLMPGMLSAAQMRALRAAKGREFDRLFLEGMIQHHEGALTMVAGLFAAAGSAQDADLFNFATEVDSGQRAEIKRMQEMLRKL